MTEEKKEQQADDDFELLRKGLESKVVRDILWTHVIEPSKVLDKYESNDPMANARFLARENLGKDLIENIKAANLEAWFQMIRDNQFEEEVELAEEKSSEGSE